VSEGYRLSISSEGADEYKLIWGDHVNDLQAYCVSGERVRKASESVRARLDALSAHFRNCEITGVHANYSPFFQNLAIAGADLTESILSRSTGDQNSANFIRVWLSSLGAREPLSIVISGTPLHVPWNFLFRGDPYASQGLRGTIDDFNSFWTNIFDINVSYSRTSFLSHENSCPSSSFILHAVHQRHSMTL
jgi:hypothetical protein